MKRIKEIKKAIKEVVAYPPKGHSRRTKDGYPAELIYDEFAYKRMVDSYRDALRNILEIVEKEIEALIEQGEKGEPQYHYDEKAGTWVEVVPGVTDIRLTPSANVGELVEWLIKNNTIWMQRHPERIEQLLRSFAKQLLSLIEQSKHYDKLKEKYKDLYFKLRAERRRRQ